MPQDIHNPFFARLYTGVLARGGPKGQDLACRREILAGLRGTVVEIGPGPGPNFARYPPEVERVIAVEPEPYLRAKATARAAEVATAVEVLPGDADALPVADGAADAVVLALVLCSVPDQARWLAQVRRVLRPGGAARGCE